MIQTKSAFGIPAVPDRSAEVIWATLAALGMLASIALAIYIWARLQLPDAMWATLSIALMPSMFVWPAIEARRKRLKAIREFERYRAGVRKAAEEI